MAQITISELPETFQKLLQEVEHTNIPLTITQEGQPLVIVYPAKTRKPHPPFGFMQGTGKITGDIVSPVEQPWAVLQ